MNFVFLSQKNNVLDIDEKIRTFSKVQPDLATKGIIKKKSQYIYRNARLIKHGWNILINIADKKNENLVLKHSCKWKFKIDESITKICRII